MAGPNDVRMPHALDDIVTIGYDSNGKQSWVARYNGPDNGFDAAGSLATDKDGNAYVSGITTGPTVVSGGSARSTNLDLITIKYGKDGQEQWRTRNIIGATEYRSHGLGVDEKGNVYLTASWLTGKEKGGTFSLKYDNNGNQKWMIYHDVVVQSTVVDNRGNLYVLATNTRDINKKTDFVILKYPATN